MKNLKVWQKLSLLGLILLIPFAVVMWQLVSSVRTLNLEPARTELQGLEYLAPLRDLTHEIQIYHALSQASISGDPGAKNRAASHRDEIEKRLSAMDETDQRLNGALHTSKDWDAVHSSFRSLLDQPGNPSSEGNLNQYHTLTTKIRTLIQHVADNSKLSLDSEITTFYLMDVIVFQQPQLAERLEDSHAVVLGMLLTPQDRGAAKVKADRIDGVVDYLVDNVDSSLLKLVDIDKSLTDKITTVDRENQSVVRNYVRLHNSFTAGAVRLPTHQYSEAGIGAIDATYKLSDALNPMLVSLIQIRIDGLQRRVFHTLLCAILGLFIVTVIGVFLIRDVTRPLQTTVSIASLIADGDLSRQLSKSDRKDELGALLDAFGRMLVSLRSMTGNVTEAVNQLGSSSSEILASMSQLSATSAETASAVSETTTTVEEVRQTAHVSNDKAQIVAESAQLVAQTAQEGKDAAEQSTRGMERIRGQMDAIAQSMIRLSEQSTAISEIIASVEDLTQQSNLLAVNAAIEAAKAGEQGKGFGVVAQEVKNLAEQSKQATGQVRTLLGDIQKATAAAVMATEQGTKVVEEGVAQSGQAGEAIVRLSESIDTAAQASIQIAASSQQQLIGVDQVAIAMDNVRQASLQNLDSVHQLEIAARDLNELGMKLKDMISQYKL